ncbi:TetR/AcrR family transcriptional regulator [Caldibacillus lycopersici]|uniref:TetR/AcrR family transcriptional regulator n=1 Tax=Perspicuibacillus lycopersici TaxID=1325689 RepID=A0AAE3ISM7_9BACI|nr:TetR/AcrR family transcriptional regulator [Perspicuibacillus lycopersici]MCU9612903.1 TetR/AcrR family transcriptional regulator [Perspicuibacillus lycopersici]
MDGFERRREQKKKNILEASLQLFKTFGVAKVTIPEIAKQAEVSQVTIYNYFGSKDHLVHEVIIYYVNQIWVDYEQLFGSDLPFPDKIKQIIFEKKETASNIHEDFFHYFIKEYADEESYVEKFYREKALGRFIELFDEGKKQGYIDPNLSNEAIIFYIQMVSEYFQKNEVDPHFLSLTEDLTKIFFYGIVGNQAKKQEE